jgi:hypothetical protein
MPFARALYLLILAGCLILNVTAQEAPPQGMVIFYDGNLRLRQTPADAAAIMGYLAPETSLTILSRTGDSVWLEVQTADGETGWVLAQYIRLTSDLDAIAVNPEFAVPFDAAALISGITSHSRHIFERGQQLGNRADIFSKVGDSITIAPHTLFPIGEGIYDLGAYTHLQPLIDFYSRSLARTHNSFANESLAAQIGWMTNTLLMPQNANPDICQYAETPLACEYRLVKPAVALIMLGTNDVEHMGADLYRVYLRQIVAISIEQGVIPVLTTIPPRPGFETGISQLNQTIVEVARTYSVPLLDYYTALVPLPNFGLDVDKVHPSIPSLGYNGAANFNTYNLNYGYVMRNLTVLHALNALWEQVIQPTQD